MIYTAPIKALSNQKYKEFSRTYGEKNVGIITGDVQKNTEALILIMTTEIYRNMVLSRDSFVSNISYVIFDEIHFINDIDRGYVWEESIIFSKPNVRVLCLSATIPNADEFAKWIESIKQHEVIVVRHEERPVPLHVSFYDAEIGITSLKNLNDAINTPSYDKVMGRRARHRPKNPSHLDLVSEIKGNLPCLFFCFSRVGCQKHAIELLNRKLFQPRPEISAFIRTKLENSSPEINKLTSTRILRQTLPFGIGFHHAGMLPILKEIVEELFEKGMIKVLYTTETFALGINMPAKSVCFESLRKFDGVSFRFMNSKEYFQIAGRAGRRGIDREGFVYVMIERKHFDYEKIKKLVHSDTSPISSQFRLSVNTVLNLISQHDEKEIDDILCRSFHSFQKYGTKFMDRENAISHNAFSNWKKKLQKMGYLQGSTLTDKGTFASRIYSDEILIGEIFATRLYRGLDEYKMLLVLACLCYEGSDRTEFYRIHASRFSEELKKILWNDSFLKHEKRFREIDNLTALIHPLYHKRGIFSVIENTNLLEGDVLRLFRQMTDRFGQIKSATMDDKLRDRISACQKLIDDCLGEVDTV
ncbi:DEAD/DEAH box helicase [Candidatus Woesearchaeota archaeon]|nr:DEAD/DEAH box helicase [Candidatus Woesearchaeota archaeon]